MIHVVCVPLKSRNPLKWDEECSSCANGGHEDFSLRLSLHQDAINLCEDRKAAKAQLCHEKDKEDEESGALFKLSSLGAIMSKREYRQSLPINFVPRINETMMGIYFLYKNYFRVDMLTRSENMLQAYYYWKKYFKPETIAENNKEACIDWIHTTCPLTQVIRSRREPGIRVTMAPKTYDCRGKLQVFNRRYMASYLRSEKSFSPMVFALNAEKIRNSMETRVLQIVYSVQKDQEFLRFQTEFKNSHWQTMRQGLTHKPCIFPLKFQPYKPGMEWNYPEPHFMGDPYQNTLSEINQLPPGVLLDYNLCRVRDDMVVEIHRFRPRLLPPKKIPAKEKTCEANERCYKVISDLYNIKEQLKPLSIRRSVYSHEPPAVMPLPYIGNEDDDKSRETTEHLCGSASLETLASMSGWSTDSFASTATLTPGDALYSWKILSKETCNSYRISDNVVNPKLWAHAARLEQAARIALEVDERLLMLNGKDGKVLCDHLKNHVATSQKAHFIRKKTDLEKAKIVRDSLVKQVEAYRRKMKVKKGKATPREMTRAYILEMGLRRVQAFYPDAKEDRYYGLDLSPAWMALLDGNHISTDIINTLSYLISSRDSWILTSPITDRHRNLRCDELFLETVKPMPEGIRLLLDIIIGIVVSVSIVFLIICIWLH